MCLICDYREASWLLPIYWALDVALWNVKFKHFAKTWIYLRDWRSKSSCYIEMGTEFSRQCSRVAYQILRANGMTTRNHGGKHLKNRRLQFWVFKPVPLQWRHNERDDVSNHQPHDCLLNRLFRRKSKKTSKLRVTGLCAGNSPVTGEFSPKGASNAENNSIWWRHHDM